MIQIYSKPNCNYCDRAKSLLQNAGLQYQEIMIGVEIDRESILEQFPQARTAPVVVVDGMYIGGFTQLAEHVRDAADGELLLG